VALIAFDEKSGKAKKNQYFIAGTGAIDVKERAYDNTISGL